MPLCNQAFCSRPGRLACLHACSDCYISQHLSLSVSGLHSTNSPGYVGAGNDDAGKRLGAPDIKHHVIGNLKSCGNVHRRETWAGPCHSCLSNRDLVSWAHLPWRAEAQGTLPRAPLSLGYNAQIGVLAVRLPRIESWLWYCWALWPWERELTTPCFSFLISKMT